MKFALVSCVCVLLRNVVVAAFPENCVKKRFLASNQSIICHETIRIAYPSLRIRMQYANIVEKEEACEKGSLNKTEQEGLVLRRDPILTQ